MSENASIITACITGLLLMALLVGGPVACSISADRQSTERVRAACTGDLVKDPARSAACVLALEYSRAAAAWAF